MQLPLFPLNAVLFPDGLLRLRIFEARYIDMVTQCLRDDSLFGVCLLAAGTESSTPVLAQAIGCTARVLTCDAPQPSLLHISVRGEHRFRVNTTQVQDHGLLVAHTETIAADLDHPIKAAHLPCTQLLARVLLDLENQHALAQKENTEVNPQLPVHKPYQLDSSVWVGNRLCEILQVPLKAKQKLMELEDADARLDILTQYLKQHGVLK